MDSHTRSPRTATLSMHVVKAIFGGAARHGVAESTLRQRYGMTDEVLHDIDARVPATLVATMWEEVPRMCGREHFGLELGELFARAQRSFGTHMLDASETLGDGLRRVAQFYRVFNDVHPVNLDVSAHRASLWIDASTAIIPMPRHAVEFAFAWMIETGRIITDAPVNACEVHFSHSAPPDASAHARVFGCPPRFGAARYEIVLDAQTFSLPTRRPDPELLQLLERHARELLARLPKTPEFSSRVRGVLVPMLSQGDVSIERVARGLKLSPRTVQRYLHDEGTSFHGVVDDLRRDVAIERLSKPEASIGEVAFSLGFSDQSAFHRAFVRWTGRTPGQFRRGG